MRLFVAVDPPKEIKDAIRSLQTSLKTGVSGISWTRGEGFHCTLKFLGEVADSRLPELIRALQPAAAATSFTLGVRRLGVFPGWSNPRVIWVGLEPARPELDQLRRSVESALAPLGFAPEEKAFHPHLTLGRVKDRFGLGQLPQRLKADSERTDLGSFAVDRFILFQSNLRPDGAVYTPLYEYPLGGSPQ